MLEGNSQINLTGNPNELFEEDNYGLIMEMQQRVSQLRPVLPDNPNKFTPNINNTAAYVSNEIPSVKSSSPSLG